MNKEKLKVLTGTAGSPGIVEGVVKVVEGVGDLGRFEEGDILVTKMTEPTMVIMMNKAAGIVTDTGGMTCHAAIVSRELGIPCVIATKTATSDLKDGMRVKVDGDQGRVTVLSD